VSEYVTALEARRLRFLAGKPSAEVARLWRVESTGGLEPNALVPFEQVGAPVDYRELEALEAKAVERAVIVLGAALGPGMWLVETLPAGEGVRWVRIPSDAQDRALPLNEATDRLLKPALAMLRTMAIE
jgi:hypothetical protein